MIQHDHSDLRPTPKKLILSAGMLSLSCLALLWSMPSCVNARVEITGDDPASESIPLLSSAPEPTAGGAIAGADGVADIALNAEETHPELAKAWRLLRTAERYETSPEQLAIYAQIETIAESIIESDPQTADAHFLLFASRGRRIQADNPLKSLTKLGGLNDHLSTAIELDPELADALAAKGGLLAGLPTLLGGSTAKARDYLERAIVLNPDGPGTRIQYALLLAETDQVEEARHQARIAGHLGCRNGRGAVVRQAEEILAELENRRTQK